MQETIEDVKEKPKLKLFVETPVYNKETEKSENKLCELVALWEHKTKDGKPFFTGSLGNVKVVGFYNQ